MQVDQELVAKTYFWDRARSFLGGVLETGYAGFALIIAIQVFDASNSVKGIVAAALPIGLFLNPLSLSLFSRLGFSASRIASVIAIVSGGLLVWASFADDLLGFLIPTCLAFAVQAQLSPLLVHVWTGAYPANRRGSLVAGSIRFSILSTLGFSALGGWMLDRDLDLFRVILLVIATSSILMAFAIFRMPSTPVSRKSALNPLKSLGLAITDWRFGVVLCSWMMLGFGNLMVLPLRFEYLLQPEYGIEASKIMVTTLTLAVPAIFRFATLKFWGALFDRMDFLILRMILNGLIMASIILFLTTKNLWVIGLSAAMLGTAMAGANIAWSLWVTKYAPPDLTAAYMSVHTFTTGIRGVLSPFLGFYLLSAVGATGTAGIGSGLVLLSILIVFALYWSQRPKAKAR